jgi:hypothetical protein
MLVRRHEPRVASKKFSPDLRRAPAPCGTVGEGVVSGQAARPTAAKDSTGHPAAQSRAPSPEFHRNTNEKVTMETPPARTDGVPPWTCRSARGGASAASSPAKSRPRLPVQEKAREGHAVCVFCVRNDRTVNRLKNQTCDRIRFSLRVAPNFSQNGYWKLTSAVRTPATRRSVSPGDPLTRSIGALSGSAAATVASQEGRPRAATSVRRSSGL